MEYPPEGIQVQAIRPQIPLPVSRITTNKNKVRQGVQQGFFDAFHVLNKMPYAQEIMDKPA